MARYRIVAVIIAIVLAISTTTPARSQSGLSDGLVACWSLDEPDGPRADAVNFHHLTDINTVGYGGGKIGNAAYPIQANGEYLIRSVSSDPVLAPSQFTVSMWFYPQAGFNASYLWGYNTGSITVYGGYSDATDKFSFVIPGYTPTSTTATYAPGQWYLVTWTYTPTAISIIVNQTKQTWSYSSTLGTRTLFYLGVSTTGYIDNAAMWSEVKSDADIDDYYNGGNGVSCEDIMGSGGGGGTVVIDDGSAIYEVDLPSGELGTIKQQITSGDIGIITGLAGVGLILLFDVMRKVVYGARHK